jgi:hypothetical protein
MKAFALLLLSVLSASIASAQSQSPDMTVFGLHLGEKLAIPECGRLTKKSDIYAENVKAPCFERFAVPWAAKSKVVTPVVTESVMIIFPYAEQPTLSSSGKLMGQIVDGSLESIGFNTSGLSAQERTISSLKEKYGDPSKVLDETKQNAFGAKFDSPVAIWGFENLTVIYQATTDKIDSGMVNIDTKKGSDFRDASLKALRPGPKL